MDKLGERIAINKYEYAQIKVLLDKDNTVFGAELVDSSVGFDEVCSYFYKTFDTKLNYSDSIDFYSYC
jgi:hypothetical protein